ncbi:hypothetical protein FUAX_14860 [Fulvitalea axinellae]|uniref:Uncharacterized protein n=1 Tax=Fulvitalea axinellae TaxID=1182444 RepID=A0AAU9CRI9_9BACT|nr:hypothetical protein FUAX_14860 [Fulvitalea axinellae]
MSLSKKKSRPITVDGVDFRYSISTSKIDNDWNFRLNLTIQIASGEGSVLTVHGIVTRNFWLDFSEYGKYGKENYPVFKPSDISRVIKAGLKNGWVPEEKGSPHILELDNSFVKSYAK